MLDPDLQRVPARVMYGVLGLGVLLTATLAGMPFFVPGLKGVGLLGGVISAGLIAALLAAKFAVELRRRGNRSQMVIVIALGLLPVPVGAAVLILAEVAGINLG